MAAHTIAVSFLLCAPLDAGASPLVYPPAERDSVVDVYHGIRIPDPYRRLEDLENAGTTHWLKAESDLTRSYLDRLPGREAVTRRLTELWSYSRTDLPWREGGRVFFTEQNGLEQQASFYALYDDGSATRILDPHVLAPDGNTAIRDFSVSPNGRWMTYSRSTGGADVVEMHVRDLATGQDRPDLVPGLSSDICWTHDGAGFFYVRRPDKKQASPTAAQLEKQLCYHPLGAPAVQDRVIHEWKDARWLYSMMSDDGRRLITVAETGSISWMYTIDLSRADRPDLTRPLIPLLPGVEADHTPMGTVGDTLYAFTDLHAPKGAVIALDLNQGSEAKPRTIIPESDDVIRRATVAGDRLAVHYLHDVKSRLVLFSLRGKPAGEVRLPGIGALGWALNGRHSAPELWYSFTSFLSPETVYRYDLSTGTSRALHPPQLPFDPSQYETQQVFYTSKDGTRVPMFVTAKKGLSRNGKNPVFLTAYGGYGMTLTPSYRPDLPFWLEEGGVYAVANLRGGGEYGEAWHQGGALAHKQNSFDDFIAAAEYLVREGYTVPQKIAMYGRSNGGLLIGAMITQRPDLFAVALADAGHYDMLRYQKFTAAAAWIPEYGSSDNPEQFSYLRAYSPLQNVRPGTCYPATMLLTGDHDDRVVPSHAYKFAATLQTAQACERPILLRVSSNASHSYASSAEELSVLTDMWAFILSAMDR
jgi:prolyl oligopeptidase